LAEALGVATDFAPSTLVAPLVGVGRIRHGLDAAAAPGRSRRHRRHGGARRPDRRRLQVGLEISKLGKRVHLSTAVVEAHLGARGWRDAPASISCAGPARSASRGGVIGYLGIQVTFATVWAIVALLAGEWAIGFLLLAMRLNVAIVAGMIGPRGS
jgi:hypothetical protein